MTTSTKGSNKPSNVTTTTTKGNKPVNRKAGNSSEVISEPAVVRAGKMADKIIREANAEANKGNKATKGEGKGDDSNKASGKGASKPAATKSPEQAKAIGGKAKATTSPTKATVSAPKGEGSDKPSKPTTKVTSGEPKRDERKPAAKPDKGGNNGKGGKGSVPVKPKPGDKGSTKGSNKPSGKGEVVATPTVTLTLQAARCLESLAVADSPMTRNELKLTTGQQKGWSKLLGAATKADGGKAGDNGLVARGLVECERDGRGFVYTITRQGRAALKAHQRAVVAAAK